MDHPPLSSRQLHSTHCGHLRHKGMYVDPDGVLRTDHQVRLWAASAVRLHYKLEQAS